MTEQLGQQSMIEAPKPRSLIVPKGCGAWWGVDPSTRCIALGWVKPDGSRGVRSDQVPRIEHPGSRLSVLRQAGRMVAIRAVVDDGAWPGVIGIEQPSGSSQQVNHELEFAVGALIAGIYDGVMDAYTGLSDRGEGVGAAGPPRMELVVGSFWKKAACGNGAIRKTRKVPGKKNPQAVPFEEYDVLKWARLNGYEGTSWDECDALGVAVAMERTWDLVQR